MRHDDGQQLSVGEHLAKKVYESFPRRVRLPAAGDERPLRDVVPTSAVVRAHHHYLPAFSR